MSLFTNYDDWRNTMIKHAGSPLIMTIAQNESRH